MGNCNHYFPLYIVNKMHTDETKLEQNADFTIILPCLKRYTRLIIHSELGQHQQHNGALNSTSQFILMDLYYELRL